MKDFVRKLIWKLLGPNYEKHLNNQRRITYLDDVNNFKIGQFSYNNGAKVWKWNTNSNLTIGNFCSIANDVNFILDSGNHDMFKITTSPLFHNLYSENDIVKYNKEESTFKDFKNKYQGVKHSINIKNEVWIGAGVTILPGVTIGNGAIILAGSVVTKSVEDFSIVGGIPASHINYRFPVELHKKLNDIAWWDWDADKVKANIDCFNLEPNEFVNLFDRNEK